LNFGPVRQKLTADREAPDAPVRNTERNARVPSLGPVPAEVGRRGVRGPAVNHIGSLRKSTGASGVAESRSRDEYTPPLAPLGLQNDSPAAINRDPGDV